MKTTIPLLVLFALVLIGGYWWSQRPANDANQPAATSVPVDDKGGDNGNSGPGSGDDKPSANTSYTMAQVATHNTAQSCWTTISGSVYDLTAWISQHPGGVARILGLCGKDGTQAFMGQHGGQDRPEAALASFKIGALAQ